MAGPAWEGLQTVVRYPSRRDHLYPGSEPGHPRGQPHQRADPRDIRWEDHELAAVGRSGPADQHREPVSRLRVEAYLRPIRARRRHRTAAVVLRLRRQERDSELTGHP